MFIDLSKAFDILDHTLLLKELEHYGIRAQSLKLLESYLSDRFQMVKFRNQISHPLSILCGVPQWSVLGLLLFPLYINDIRYCSRSLWFSLFADDTTTLYSHSSIDILFINMNREQERRQDFDLEGRLVSISSNSRPRRRRGNFPSRAKLTTVGG